MAFKLTRAETVQSHSAMTTEAATPVRDAVTAVFL
jgi:hypothetical protein